MPLLCFAQTASNELPSQAEMWRIIQMQQQQIEAMEGRRHQTLPRTDSERGKPLGPNKLYVAHTKACDAAAVGAKSATASVATQVGISPPAAHDDDALAPCCFAKVGPTRWGCMVRTATDRTA